MGSDAVGRGDRRCRAERAVAASSLATLVALASHLSAGGVLPPLLAVLAVLVVSWLPALLLVGRKNSPLGLALVIGGSELGFHLAFSLLATDVPSSAVAAVAPGMPGMPGMGVVGGPMPVAVHGPPMTGAGPMWLAHVAAAVLTWVLWLRGEAAARAVLIAASRLVRALLPLVCALVRVGSDARVRIVEHAEALPRRVPIDVAPRRGPPEILLTV